MANQDWLPALWQRDPDELDPFTALRKQIDSMFDNADRGMSDWGTDFRVRSNLSETTQDICITAELPGLSDKDVDVSVSGDRITIKGEKKSEKDEKKEEEGREFHRIERMSGSFRRTMRLPFDIEADKVTATVQDGILTVTIPKPARVLEQTKKVQITSA